MQGCELANTKPLSVGTECSYHYVQCQNTIQTTRRNRCAQIPSRIHWHCCSTTHLFYSTLKAYFH